jgi:hypothetical protein
VICWSCRISFLSRGFGVIDQSGELHFCTKLWWVVVMQLVLWFVGFLMSKFFECAVFVSWHRKFNNAMAVIPLKVKWHRRGIQSSQQ